MQLKHFGRVIMRKTVMCFSLGVVKEVGPGDEEEEFTEEEASLEGEEESSSRDKLTDVGSVETQTTGLGIAQRIMTSND